MADSEEIGPEDVIADTCFASLIVAEDGIELLREKMDEHIADA